MKHLTAAFLALGLILGATTHVHALPIGLAIAGALGFVGTAATIVGSVIVLAAGLALQFVASALLRKKGSADVGGTAGKMQTGGVVPRSFPFGTKALVTHSLTYWNSFGQDGKTPNAYVAFEFSLADLPVGGGRAALQELWPNGTKATWNPAASADTYGIPIPEFNKNGRDHMWVEVFDGTQTTADAFLVSQFSSDPNWPYADTRVGFGVVKVRIICRLNNELFSGFPSFKFVVKGVPFYDAREDATAGGDGTQRWSDASTWVATENPIVIAQNLIRGVSYDGVWFFGGQTVSAAQLPASAWFAAANECDATITNEDASTEKQFRCAGEIRLDMEPADALDDLMRACNGRIGEIGGVYKPHVGPAGLAVLSITDDDIRTNEDQILEPFSGLQDIVNSINAKYIEPGEGWTAKDAPALVDAALEVEDGGRRQPVDLQYEYVPFARQVQRQNRATLTDYRRERRHVLPLAPEAWRLEPAVDFIAWTSERNGYASKLFSVEGATDMDGYLVGVTLKEVDPGDYDDWTSQAPVIAPSPIVFPPTQAIEDFAVSAVLTEAFAGIAIPGILLSWNGTDIDDVVGVEYQVKRYESDAILIQGQAPLSAVAAGSHVISGGITPATSYQVRARFVPGSGRAVAWSDWKPVVTLPSAVVLQALDSPLRQIIESMTGFGADSIRDLLRQYEERLEAQGEAVARAITQTNILLAKAENNSTASIVEERSVRASADEANATLITGLSSSLDTLDGTVTGLASTVSETSATVTTQGGTLTALASDLSTLTATVGTTSTTVSGHTTAITNLEGETYGSWGVEITTQKNIIGETVKKVSGFKLHQAGGEGEIVSEFRINSDKFSVFPADSDPNTNTYDTPLFTIGSVAGGPSNRAGLNAFAFLDGTLQARMLVTDDVVVANTIQLQNSIVTVPHVITYSTPVAGTGIGNLIDIVDTMFEVTVPNGQSIPIFFNGGMSLEYLNTSTTRWDLDFKVSWRNVGGSYGTESSLFAMTCGSTATVSAPFGGAYTITGTGAIQQVRARLVWTAASNIRAGNRYLSCQAAKR